MGGDHDFISMLAGGKRQSIGASNAVAAAVCADPSRSGELWEAVRFPDPLVQMRAVDALSKASAELPEVVADHADDVLDELAVSPVAQIRWHTGLLIPRLQLDPARLRVAVRVLETLLDDTSRIARANAVDGIVRLADAHDHLAELADETLSKALESPYPSVRARARQLMK